MDFDRLREKPRPRRRLAAAGRRVLLAAGAAMLLWAAQIPATAQGLRVATFNIHEGLGANETSSHRDVAQILKRLGPDVVGFQELQSDFSNLATLGKELGLPHQASKNDGYMAVGLLSKHPVVESHWVWEKWLMTREILLARIDVPETSRKVWVAVLHLKCCNKNGTESSTRARELKKLREAILKHCDPRNDLIIVMGDFNLVAPGEDANKFFVPEAILKLNSRHAGTLAETWTWRGDQQSALDHIMVNAPVRQVGVESEVYNIQKDAAGFVGLKKFGIKPPPTADYSSDHLPVFADLRMDQPPPFKMDGLLDSEGFTVSTSGITLRAAVRGTHLYVATRSTGNQPGGEDHHIFITDTLLNAASVPAPWAKRGFTAAAVATPLLAAEGENAYLGWFNAGNSTKLRKWADTTGVLEGSIDLVQKFGAVPEFLFIAAVAYQTSDSSNTNPSLGRVLAQAPAAVIADDNITPDEFLRIPLRPIQDADRNGRFDFHYGFLPQKVTFPRPANPVYSADARFTLSASSESGHPISFTSSNASVVSIAGSIATIRGAGTVDLTASAPEFSNYAAASATHRITIDQADQTVTFSAPAAQVYGPGKTLALSANSTSGLPVAFSSGNTSIATIQHNLLTIHAAGTVVLTASQAGNANWKAAPLATRSLVVAKGKQTLVFGKPADRPLQTRPFTLAGTATSGLKPVFTSGNTKLLTIQGNQATMRGKGNVTVTATQPGDKNWNAAKPVQQTFTIR